MGSFSPHSSSIQVYPQSYAAASYAIDLLNKEQVVGYPEGFPVEKEQWCPLNLEKLMQRNTHLIFTAPYSHPRFIQALKNCQIPFKSLKHPSTFSDIPEQALEFCSHLELKELGFQLFLTLETFYCTLNKPIDSPNVILLQDYGRLDFIRDPIWEAFAEVQESAFSFEKLFFLKPDLLCIFSQTRTKEELLEAYPALKSFQHLIVIKSSHYHYPSFWNREAVQALRTVYETL